MRFKLIYYRTKYTVNNKLQYISNASHMTKKLSENKFLSEQFSNLALSILSIFFVSIYILHVIYLKMCKYLKKNSTKKYIRSIYNACLLFIYFVKILKTMFKFLNIPILFIIYFYRSKCSQNMIYTCILH